MAVCLSAVCAQAIGAALKERVVYQSGKDPLHAAFLDIKNNFFYFGAGDQLFKCRPDRDGVHVLPLRGGSIQDIFIDSFSPNTVYVAAEKGVYVSHDFGASFDRIFSASLREDETFLRCRSVVAFGGRVLVGTEEGLYVSDTGSWIWNPIRDIPRSAAVMSIVYDSGSRAVWVATDHGVYRSPDGSMSFKRVMAALSPDDEQAASDEEMERAMSVPLCLFIDTPAARVFVGTTKGLFAGTSDGTAFHRVGSGVLQGLAVEGIAASSDGSDRLLIATDKGGYSFDPQEDSATLLTSEVSHDVIAGSSKDEVVWIADKKVFLTVEGARNGKPGTSTVAQRSLVEAAASEPTIDEIRAAAIRYNEVGTEKVSQWRRGAQIRAFFPEVSLDYDKTVDIYQTATTQRIVEGPNDWGVSFKWDIGDLVWNPYQKDIDTRSRLNTQLRIEIIEEVTRLYFERKRLCRELKNAVPGSGDHEMKSARIEEIQAILDGYTGGHFSRCLKRNAASVN